MVTKLPTGSVTVRKHPGPEASMLTASGVEVSKLPRSTTAFYTRKQTKGKTI